MKLSSVHRRQHAILVGDAIASSAVGLEPVAVEALIQVEHGNVDHDTWRATKGGSDVTMSDSAKACIASTSYSSKGGGIA